MKHKKIMTILVVIIITAAVFSACDDEADEDIQPTAAAVSHTGDIQIQEQENELMQKITPDLPDYDLEGYAFRVFTMDWGDSPDWTIWNSRDITAEEETGSPVNDAVYKRNRILEEKYNFTIEQLSGTDRLNTLRTAVAAKDDYFDIITMGIRSNAAAAQEGLLVNLFDVSYLDFEKPWWDQGAAEGIGIGNKLFFSSGDFLLVNMDASPVILFNKQLLTDLNLENPYELVQTNQWTLPKLYEMAKTAAADLNGNGAMDMDTDRFGFVFSVDFSIFALMNGAGVRISGKDTDGLPVLSFGSDRDFSVASAVRELWRADFTWLQDGIIDMDPSLGDSGRAFAEGRGLFLGTNMRVIEQLRGMETDFGILPLPRLNEQQAAYGHSISGIFGQTLAVPAFFDDDDILDKIGFMLEAISAESRYTVIPAYYDVQLTGQLIRDEESREMLDIIFNSRVWDAGIIYDWVNFNMAMAVSAGTLASAWESNLVRIENAMQTTVDTFENIVN